MLNKLVLNKDLHQKRAYKTVLMSQRTDWTCYYLLHGMHNCSSITFYISPRMSASTETTSGVSAVIKITCSNSSLRSSHTMKTNHRNIILNVLIVKAVKISSG